jgi:zinc protease
MSTMEIDNRSIRPVHALEYRLANGLTVVLHQDRSLPIASLVVMYHVGSKNETRTGLAHLFEHLMFEGSQHVAHHGHFQLLQEIGAQVNGTTSCDRTNYYESLPRHHLELALYLESDRMGFLLPTLTQDKLDNQRDVVINERRQHVDNQPYGRAQEVISEMLYPEGHPYRWPVIGYIEDLASATLEDVSTFFRTFYAPNNAVVSVAGDFDIDLTREWIDRYFGSFAPATDVRQPRVGEITLGSEKRGVLEDNVQLPRLYMTWPSFRTQTRGDAVMDVLTDILSVGKNSRLHKSLIYEQQIAQSVIAYQNGSEIGGEAGIVVTARPGIGLSDIEHTVHDELQRLMSKGIADSEIEMSLNAKEFQLVNSHSTTLGRANLLATYETFTGDAENINREFSRFSNMTASELQATAKQIFSPGRVVLSVVPNTMHALAAEHP